MIDELISLLGSSEPFRELERSARQLGAGEELTVVGVPGSLAAIAALFLHDRIGRQILYVAPDREAGERFSEDTALRYPNGGKLFDPPERSGALQESGTHAEILAALHALTTQAVPIMATSPAGLVARLPAPAAIRGTPFVVAARAEMPHQSFLNRIGRLGFERKDFVEERGDYAARGGIVDLFPFVGEQPLRIEFSGDEIESVREFDPASQRSLRELSSATIVPDLLKQTDGAESTATILDFLSPDAILLLDEPETIRQAFPPAGPDSADHQTMTELMEMFPQIRIAPLRGAKPDALDLGGVAQHSFNGSIGMLRRAMTEQQTAGWHIFVTCDSQSELDRLRELLRTIRDESEPDRQPDLRLEEITFSLEALHGGFTTPPSSVAVYTEHQIFNRVKRRGRKPPRFKGLVPGELNKLRKGDYVVHRDYGIGRFDGLKKISVRNVEQEVVTLLYEEKDTLYVNLNYINRLQKYSSREGHVPKLTRLGSPEWDRLKTRAKRRVKDVARELIRLYARRKQMPGFAFPPDSPWQNELEASFMYEDTVDQSKATLDVKQDMQSPSPMDRLICGDVGFGKTEVAVRAAFKAVLGGKQAAVLVPTTILAMQHYQTFVDRVSRYGVAVQVLSRFKSRAEQSAILEQLKQGTIDIVIGTHRLLSKDVGFKKLGLLVIDEEHRFGVTAKEKLRQLRNEVDTLTLTATPIPRTLHFSLLGARDLSIIATPPPNRLPVITEITQWNDDLIRDAVTRELHRGGQVYVVHDRVQTIEEVCDRLRRILPSARLRFAHGKMHAHDLEEVMMGFLERAFDILVSTKIIESGLDIPNVNTIIINRADRFGMAELYQLRGRVGRSNVQAYAYLLTPPVEVMPRTTLQRLQAVEEFTELGSGFNLAMRDLEIRGAGNLLGSEQSGFIDAMGFDTYTRVLDEAVRELKEEEFKDLFAAGDRQKREERETVVEAEFDALIPGEYVANDIERLSIYRRLYELSTPAQLEEIEEELKDRFGPLPRAAANLLEVVRIRLIAVRAGFVKVHIARTQAVAEFPPASDGQFYEGEAFQAIMGRITAMRSEGLTLRQSGPVLTLSAPINDSGDEKEILASAGRILQKLAG